MKVRHLAATLATLALVSACAAEGTRDKAGSGTLVLRLATIDEVDNNGQSYGPAEFVAALEDVSGGRIQVEVDTEEYADGAADAETRMLAAIEAREVDGGWPSTRAFAAAGIPGLEVVEAPMTLTSYDAVRDLVTSPVADTLLERLDGTGVVGLGLAVGPLRRPFAAGEPMLDVSDWDGAAFRSFNSPVQDAAIRALGGEPVQVGWGWPDLTRSGELRGLEFDVAQYYENGMTTEAGELTGNVVLWPKVFVLGISRERWDSLTDQQRSWVRAATDRAVTASVEGEYDEHSVARRLCANGGFRLHEATPEQLAGWRQRLRPVLDRLAQDRAWDELRAIADRHPDVEALPAEDCVEAPTVRTVDRIPVPPARGDLPDGVYRIEVTPDDLAASLIGPPSDGYTGVWTLTVRAGGYELACQPLDRSTGIDCNYAEGLGPGFDSNPREVGRLFGTGGTVYLVHDTRAEHRLTDCSLPPSDSSPTACLPRVVNRVDWRLDGDMLVMSRMVSDGPTYQLVVGPWERIG